MEYISLVVCVFCCALLIANRSNVEAIFAITALYVTLHFSYTLPTLLVGATGDGWIAKLGSVPEAKIAGATFVAVLVLVIVRTQLNSRSAILSLMPMLAVAALVAIGFLIERCCRVVRWQDLASVVAFFIVAGLLSICAGKCSLDKLSALARRHAPAVAMLVLLSIGLGMFEVATQRGQAQFRLASGELVVRASSIFINPNWLGAWLACAAMLLVLLCNALADRAWLLRSVLFCIGVGLFLSGSRSAAIIFLSSGLLFLMLRGPPRLPTFQAGLSVFAGLSFFTFMFSQIFIPSARGFSVLSSRWTTFLVEILNYLSRAQGASPEFAESVAGRLTGALRDNGFAAVYDEAGLLALAAVAAFWLSLFAAAAYTLAQPATRFAGAASMSLLLFATLLSLQMRSFQVFPIWLVVAGIVAVVVGAAEEARRTQAWAREERGDPERQPA